MTLYALPGLLTLLMAFCILVWPCSAACMDEGRHARDEALVRLSMRPGCSVQAFLASAKIQGAFQPLPSPPLQLTQLDQCRIRDRSTIMARHLFADRGDAFADEQV